MLQRLWRRRIEIGLAVVVVLQILTLLAAQRAAESAANAEGSAYRASRDAESAAVYSEQAAEDAKAAANR